MAQINNHLVVMAGGVGSRFWPTERADLNRLFPGNPEGQTAARTMMAGLTAQPIYKKHHDPAELLDSGS